MNIHKYCFKSNSNQTYQSETFLGRNVHRNLVYIYIRDAKHIAGAMISVFINIAWIPPFSGLVEMI